eukprot:5364171-Alexandrium_andersonii.AAC.1
MGVPFSCLHLCGRSEHSRRHALARAIWIRRPVNQGIPPRPGLLIRTCVGSSSECRVASVPVPVPS